MTSWNGNIFCVTGPLCGEFTGPGEFPTQRPVTRSFDVFFDLRLNKWLSKQPWGWWFETPSWSLWRQCNDCYCCMQHRVVLNHDSRHYSDIIWAWLHLKSLGFRLFVQRKHQSSASLAFVRVTRAFPHKGQKNPENASIWWRHHDWIGGWIMQVHLPKKKCTQLICILMKFGEILLDSYLSWLLHWHWGM